MEPIGGGAPLQRGRNHIDIGHSAARDRMRRVNRLRSGSMAPRWTAAAFEEAPKGARQIIWYGHF